MKYILTAVIAAILSGGLVYGITNINVESSTDAKAVENSEIGSTFGELEQDIEYYRNISGYIYLLDQDTYKKVEELGSTIEEDQELMDHIIMAYTEKLFRTEPSVQEKLTTVIQDIKTKKTDTDYFEKNTTCASLIPGIQSQLSERASDSVADEELEFTFYSPTLDTCIYVTDYSVTDYSDGYNNETSKKVYNANTGTTLETFRIYSTKDRDDTNSNERSIKNQRDFVRYILENSNYKMELLEDASYIYVGF